MELNARDQQQRPDRDQRAARALAARFDQLVAERLFDRFQRLSDDIDWGKQRRQFEAASGRRRSSPGVTP
jgi:hypothetical protein